MLTIITGLLTAIALTAALGLTQEGPKLVDVKYVGHTGYPAFTRLVFDTGGLAPDKFKVNQDIEGGQVVIYPLEGMLIFSFMPVRSVDDLVRDVDFVEKDTDKRGIVVRLTTTAQSVRVTGLTDPNRLVLDVFRKPKEGSPTPYGRQVRTVVIDPGHGGKESGAVGEEGVKEKDLVLDVALRLRGLLTKQGFRVLLTRSGDVDASPDDRAGAANNAHADLYIALHAGGSFTPSKGGIAIYTVDAEAADDVSAPAGITPWEGQQAQYLPDSQELARHLAASLDGVYGKKPDVRETRLTGLSGLTMPAALVELGDLADPDQKDQLSQNSFRNKLAGLLTKGITDYAKGVDRQ